MVEKTIFGTMEDGREVSRYTLTNQNGVSASFLDLGAIWSTMLVPDRNGEMADVLLGHETVADLSLIHILRKTPRSFILRRNRHLRFWKCVSIN